MTNDDEPIAVRHLQAGGRRIPVLFFRNAGGSVCGRFVFGEGDTPIVDGPTPDAVLLLVADMVDSLLLARELRESALRQRAQLARRRRAQERRGQRAKSEQHPDKAAAESLAAPDRLGARQ